MLKIIPQCTQKWNTSISIISMTLLFMYFSFLKYLFYKSGYMEYSEMNFLALKMKLKFPIVVKRMPSKGKIFRHFKHLKQKWTAVALRRNKALTSIKLKPYNKSIRPSLPTRQHNILNTSELTPTARSTYWSTSFCLTFTMMYGDPLEKLQC
jgi:hypothetical protein